MAVWLASALAMCSQIRFSFKDLQATGVKVSDAEVQCKCNLRTMRDMREPRRETSCDPEGTIYAAQTGVSVAFTENLWAPKNCHQSQFVHAMPILCSG